MSSTAPAGQSVRTKRKTKSHRRTRCVPCVSRKNDTRKCDSAQPTCNLCQQRGWQSKCVYDPEYTFPKNAHIPDEYRLYGVDRRNDVSASDNDASSSEDANDDADDAALQGQGGALAEDTDAETPHSAEDNAPASPPAVAAEAIPEARNIVDPPRAQRVYIKTSMAFSINASQLVSF